MADYTDEELQQLETLKANSPYSLPDNPSSAGYSASQIKEKFYAGLIYLFDLLKANKDDAADTYVPYADATGNVDLGSYGLKAGHIGSYTANSGITLRDRSGNLVWLGAYTQNPPTTDELGTEEYENKLWLPREDGELATKTYVDGLGAVPANYDYRATALNGITIGSTTYKLVPQGTIYYVDSLAIGKNSKATGDASIAIGYESQTELSFATAIGAASKAKISYATAIGATSHATAQYAAAIGFGSQATKSSTIAVGYESLASENYAIAVGRTSNATGASTIAIGYKSQASGISSIALGRSAVTTAQYSTAIGYGAKNYIPYSVSFDGGSSNRKTVQLYNPSKIFFRNEDVNSSYTSLDAYTNGKTLQDILDALAASLTVSIDPSTYVMTFALKNADGTTLCSSNIDLPLESTVVNGSYDNENQRLVLTLTSGSTINIPVGDLVSNLASESYVDTAIANLGTFTDVEIDED